MSFAIAERLEIRERREIYTIVSALAVLHLTAQAQGMLRKPFFSLPRLGGKLVIFLVIVYFLSLF